jgi:hypothetical protein
LLDEHEAAPRVTVTDHFGKHLFERRRDPTDKGGNGLFVDVLEWLERRDHYRTPLRGDIGALAQTALTTALALPPCSICRKKGLRRAALIATK